METFDFEDGNGLVAASRHKNPDGSLGGWVAATANVYGNARVWDEAWVWGEAQVSGNARVYGNARVLAPYSKVTRSDGYEFAVFKTAEGFCIVAGCRYFESWAEAEAHWLSPGHPLREENAGILTFLRKRNPRAGRADHKTT